MTRLLCRTAGCAQRYLCHDALNALYENTHLVDSILETEYHPKFLEYLQYLQDEDLTTCGAMTDAKGPTNSTIQTFTLGFAKKIKKVLQSKE